MSWLSTQIRCNKCGFHLQDHQPQTCPSCQADLANEDDFWSELQDWREVREKGMVRYVCFAGVLGFGIPNLASLAFQQFRNGNVDVLFVVVISALSGLAGALFSVYSWRCKEREYCEATNPEERQLY